MPRLRRRCGPPVGVSRRSRRAGATQAATSGAKSGTAATCSSAWVSVSSSAAQAPRLAASIAPGPPPVTTSIPAEASRCPSTAAAANSPVPRRSACPPMTPTTRRPATTAASASDIASSWIARRAVT
ncbi:MULTISPECIES: hypothetical protein [Ornithinimicrobium]|uniref:hypothetical protein n=1 Tax=Ornithinimicrobium TaxID=125287 RepID=UPI0031584AEE